jgi:energy-converting hydrogenase B subunit D
MMLETLQASLLVFVGLGGLGVVLTREPVRQTVVLSVYGLLLALLFFVFQAPDVALSAIVVGTVALPLMILLALAKVREQRHIHQAARSEEDAP